MTYLQTKLGFAICISEQNNLRKFDRFFTKDILTEDGIKMYNLLKSEKRKNYEK